MAPENEELAVYLEQFHADLDLGSDAWKDSVSAPHVTTHLEDARTRTRERMENIGIEPHCLIIDLSSN